MLKNTKRRTAIWLCTTAVLTALNIAMSSFGVPVPGGHLYMNDIIICPPPFCSIRSPRLR